MIDSIKISNIYKIKESYNSLWILLLALAEDGIVKHCSTKISWCLEFTNLDLNQYKLELLLLIIYLYIHEHDTAFHLYRYLFMFFK